MVRIDAFWREEKHRDDGWPQNLMIFCTRAESAAFSRSAAKSRKVRNLRGSKDWAGYVIGPVMVRVRRLVRSGAIYSTSRLLTLDRIKAA